MSKLNNFTKKRKNAGATAFRRTGADGRRARTHSPCLGKNAGETFERRRKNAGRRHPLQNGANRTGLGQKKTNRRNRASAKGNRDPLARNRKLHTRKRRRPRTQGRNRQKI